MNTTPPSLNHPTPLSLLEDDAAFAGRHIGPSAEDQQRMLAALGLASLGQLLDQVLPGTIRLDRPLRLPPPWFAHLFPTVQSMGRYLKPNFVK